MDISEVIVAIGYEDGVNASMFFEYNPDTKETFNRTYQKLQYELYDLNTKNKKKSVKFKRMEEKYYTLINRKTTLF